MTTQDDSGSTLSSIALGETPVLERLIEMNLDLLASLGLDEKTYFMVRLAALAAMDAAPVSYEMNLGLASEAGMTLEEAQGAHRHLAGGRQRQGRLGRGQDAARVRHGDRAEQAAMEDQA